MSLDPERMLPVKMQKNVSRFMRRTLMKNEVLVGEARFHGFYTFSAFCAVAVYAALGVAAQYAVYRFFGRWEMLPAWVGLGLSLTVGAVLLGWIGAWLAVARHLRELAPR